MEGLLCVRMMEDNYVYSKSVLDFVAVATEFCKQLEQTADEVQEHFVDVMLRLLPLLYLKVSVIDDLPEVFGHNTPKVTEADYDFVRCGVTRIMGEKDDFLDVFVEDFKYSDQPVLQTISENLADVYQELRELVEAFREGYEEAMRAALSDAVEAFRLHWGQKLLNAQRALHDIKYGDVKVGE